MFLYHPFPVSTLPYNVQLVNVYLSTATFDEIEKDVKVTTKGVISLGHHGVHYKHRPDRIPILFIIYNQGDN